MSKGKSGFKNIKLGKDVYREIKRRGPPVAAPVNRDGHVHYGAVRQAREPVSHSADARDSDPEPRQLRPTPWEGSPLAFPIDSTKITRSCSRVEEPQRRTTQPGRLRLPLRSSARAANVPGRNADQKGVITMPDPTVTTRTSVVEDAKVTILAYGNKDWNAVRAALTPSSVYDEVASNRRVQGMDRIVSLWQGWATAFPDSKATIGRTVASGNTATIELTWRGTHTGPLTLPTGTIAPTGRKIELRACQVVEVDGDKTRSITQYFDLATLLRQIGMTS
jgi:steroid delta-isomerase-like uncharacterized protein